MRIKFYVLAMVAVAYMPVAAQETYENAKIATEDLNGTARYVGMGGALDALGADISTIATNPAGIGRFRSSKADVTAGFVSQQDDVNYVHGSKTNASFDQAGFVWSKRLQDESAVNFAINFHKSRNFDYILSADDALRHTTPEGQEVYASQNKLTFVKLINEQLYPATNDGYVRSKPYLSCNQLDDLYDRSLFENSPYDLPYLEAHDYDFDRAHQGYVGEYDFNISGSVGGRVFLGLTVGIHDVHYKHFSDYTERLIPNVYNVSSINVYDERKITGIGGDIKAGIIAMPVEEVPLFLGASVSTPTFYDLSTRNYTEVSDGVNTSYNSDSYDFKLYTPWKFGVSAGYIVGNMLALGVGYDFADYGSMSTRINDGEEDYYGYYDNSYKDIPMNNHTKSTLKGVSTLKVGMELKPIPMSPLALRAGYNYVSPMYEKDGFKDGTIQSNGSYFASATDFTNWESTNRLTLGLGYASGPFTFDVAYQFSTSKGSFYPFVSYEDNDYYDLDNVAGAVKVENNRHQMLCTLGYKF